MAPTNAFEPNRRLIVHVAATIYLAACVALLTPGGACAQGSSGASAATVDTTLEAGDGLVLFSDGVTDAIAPDGDDFGTERLVASAAQARFSRPADILAGLFGTVREFCGSAPPVDDVTMTVLRFSGTGQGAP